jgi:hypothetical protein
MNVTWLKTGQDNNGWYHFQTVDLAHAHFNNLSGVYIVWQPNGRVVRVGQGQIRDRLTSHRTCPNVAEHDTGNLHVTWAAVPAAQLDAVERFLGDKLSPLVAERFPDVQPIPVNLPW